MESEFCKIYETKTELTNKIADIFYNQNKRVLSCMALDTDDLIQLFLIKFMKYEKESFIENCKNNKYWVTLCLNEFRLLMLQQYRKAENNIKKVEIERADRQIIKEDDDFSDYEYLQELIQNKETKLWLEGYTKRAIGLKLYGMTDKSGNITRKINRKINQDIENLQEHLGIRKQPIISEVYKLQDKVIRLHLEGLTNIEIAEKLNKTRHQINNVIYHARKSGKLEKENSIYYKRKMQILTYIKENPSWTYYKVCKLFNTDMATIKRYLNQHKDKGE